MGGEWKGKEGMGRGRGGVAHRRGIGREYELRGRGGEGD